MRFVFIWHIIAVGSLLVGAFHGSPLQAEEGGGTLKFLSATPTPPASEAAPPTTSPPTTSPAQPIAHQPTTAPSSTPAQPAPPPPTDSPTSPPPVFPRVGTTARVISQPHVEPPLTNQTRQALGFYGGYSARATLSQMPRRTPIQPSSPSPRPMVRQSKPFETVHHEPTVSPYLNLYRDDESTGSAPNYFALVRPQMEQLDAARRQQREIQQLQRRLQSVGPTAAGPRYETGGRPDTGTAAHYMDTAQFYAGWRR